MTILIVLIFESILKIIITILTSNLVTLVLNTLNVETVAIKKTKSVMD